MTVELQRVEWPYVEAMVRLALGLALGLLIGLERERSEKEAGLRTFACIALLGAIGGLMGPDFALAVLALTALLTVYLNARALLAGAGAELTTSAAMLLTAMAGILCGQGHRLTPAAIIVSTTALLAWKRPLSGFSKGLTEAEMRSAIVLAILAIVIYPALPAGTLGPMGLIEPRAAWLTVLLIAAIGFVNYALLKIYGNAGADVTGFLGGLVNSSVTVNELAGRVGEVGDAGVDTAYRGIVLATAAMLARNLVLLAILSPPTLWLSLGPIAASLAACVVLILRTRRDDGVVRPVNLDLPFSLPSALKYGALFLALTVAGSLTLKLVGQAAFYGVSFIGGLFSSASSVASAAGLVARDMVSATEGARGALLASLASVLVNLPFMLRARNRILTRRLARAMTAVVACGVVAEVLVSVLV